MNYIACLSNTPGLFARHRLPCLVVAALPLLVFMPAKAEVADCSLIVKPGGSSATTASCPKDNRCPSGSNLSQCVPEFGVKLPSGAFNPSIRQWGTSALGGLNKPLDVAENPRKPGEFVVLNYGDDSITRFMYPGDKISAPQKPEKRKDSASCHFMHRPTAIAFGEAPTFGDVPDFTGQEVYGLNETGTFATTGDSCNDYTASFMGAGFNQRACSDFMGVALWAANFTTFGIQNNDFFPDDLSKKPYGSHISMIHQQPFSMGIVWEGKQAGYWTWDAGPDSGYGSIVYTNITRSHGYGGYTHTGASLRRYEGTRMTRKAGSYPVPGHMVRYDKYLLAANPAAGSVHILDTESGDVSGDVKPREEWREMYTEYSKVGNATIEKLIINELELKVPSGLALSNDRLFISDAETGKIHAVQLDFTGGHKLLGYIDTPARQIAGLEVDKLTQRIWFVDVLSNTLSVVEPQCQSREYCVASPWEKKYTQEVNADGLTAWEAHQNTNNHNNWEGCARSYYLPCPGGNPRQDGKLPVCRSEGGTWENARVVWSEGKGSCDCMGVRADQAGRSGQSANAAMRPLLALPVMAYFWLH